MKTEVTFKNEAKAAWRFNSGEKLREEYDREFCRYFPGTLSFEEFVAKCNEAKIVVIAPDAPTSQIFNMTRCPDFDSIHNLIKGYRSYPQYRNEQTLRALNDRIANEEVVDMPIFVQKRGRLTIIGGNTRANLAYINGKTCIGQVIDLD